MHSTHTPAQSSRPPWGGDALFERSRDLLCVADYSGLVRRANPTWLRALGDGQGAIPDMPLSQLVYAGDQSHLQAAFDNAVATDEVCAAIARCSGADGAQRWVEWQICADARRGLVFALGRDITAHRQAEDRLRLFEAMVEQSAIGMGITDLEGRCTYANEALRQTYGYGEALIGMSLPALLRPEDSPEAERPMAEILGAGRAGLQTMFVCDGGGARPVDLRAMLINTQGGAQSVAIMMRDITEQERAEKELAQAASLLQATLESTSDGILTVDTAGRVTNINREFIRLWGIPDALIATRDDTLLLQFVLDQLADPGAFIAKVRELYDQPDASSYDLLTFKDSRVVERYSHPQRIDGASIGRVWNFRDITDRQRVESERLALQEQVIAAQQERLRELSTPLIPIADGVVVMPLIGSLDSVRAQQVLDTLLCGVAESGARVAILDITGVSVVDTQVADGLLRAAQAVRLLGASVVLTGIRPEVAQTLVHLGADLRGIVTRGSLQSGIAFALKGR